MGLKTGRISEEERQIIRENFNREDLVVEELAEEMNRSVTFVERYLDEEGQKVPPPTSERKNQVAVPAIERNGKKIGVVFTDASSQQSDKKQNYKRHSKFDDCITKVFPEGR